MCISTFSRRSARTRHMKNINGIIYENRIIEIAPQIYVPDNQVGPSNRNDEPSNAISDDDDICMGTMDAFENEDSTRGASLSKHSNAFGDLKSDDICMAAMDAF
ncbi:zinc finger protein 746-like [Aphis craccivora]|uniref:Zinc finger protein 746-like n=1 Tax=Aphis craccivora TaxID=307492 RepID=A0A6G0VPV0_APHCR|nr:zinc finger protein 746-like [Aphis craccivora]